MIQTSDGTPNLLHGFHVHSGRESSTSISFHLLTSAAAEALKLSGDRVPTHTGEPPIAKQGADLARAKTDHQSFTVDRSAPNLPAPGAKIRSRSS